MLRIESKQLSLHSILYNKISENHILKKNWNDRFCINKIEEQPLSNASDTTQMIKKAREIVEDPKFMEQKGVHSIIDKDARVGRKSKHQKFFGYKTEFVMLCDENIITSVRAQDGAYVDGSYTKEKYGHTSKT